MSLTRRLFGESAVYPKLKALGHYPDYWWWLLRGKPVRSPHLVKQRTVIEYARRYHLRRLIETGTYYGEMVEAMRGRFEEICTIEFDPRLAELARRRFESYTHVRVLEGDSQLLITELLLDINEPCLFWLDAGYYGFGTSSTAPAPRTVQDPVTGADPGKADRLTSELSAILSHKVPGHVILLDDARGLTGANGRYTQAQLVSEVERRFPNRKAEVATDILRITPR